MEDLTNGLEKYMSTQVLQYKGEENEKMGMVDRETAREIAKVAASELAIHITEKIGEIRGDLRELRACIPGLIAEQIQACKLHQENRRRWSIGTILTIAGLIIANGLSAWAVFGG